MEFNKHMLFQFYGNISFSSIFREHQICDIEIDIKAKLNFS